MKDRERIVVSGVIGVLLVTWLGFLVHRSPSFPGSGLGAVFGISGALLLLVPLLTTLVKRVPAARAWITPRVSLPTLLTAHGYCGLLGTLLAIIHSGHRFESWLGITLTATLLLVVVSGFIVRYLLTYARQEITDKLALLQTGRGDLDHAWGVLERAGAETATLSRGGDFNRLAEAVADLEYAVRTHELFKRWFKRTLTVHIVLSVSLYVLLALHIGTGIYFGLRWLR